VSPVTTLPSGLLEELSTGVLVTDDVGTVLAVNQIAARTLGYAPGVLLGSNIVVLAPQLEAPARGAVKPEDVQRRRLRHKAGHRVLAERRTRARDGLVVYLLDERPAATPAPSPRRESAEQLRVVADAVPALLAYLDADARYVWVNESYQRWFGVPPESVRGRVCQELLGPAAWAALRPYVERALSGEEVTFEDRIPYKSGPARDIRASYVPHRDAGGRVCGFVALVNDISEIRAAEAALRRSEHMLEQSQSTAHVGSWEVTFPNGDHPDAELRWSTETYRIFGHAPGAVQPTQALFYGSIHPEDRERARATASEGLRQGGPFEKEYRIVRPDGSIRILHSWIRLEHDAAGKPIRMLGTVQDVTERKRAEHALKEADRRKDEFLAMLAHELRNPLAPILNAVEILESTRPEQPEITTKFRAVIARQVQHMKRLLDDLLDVSRVSQGKIQLRTERVELAALLAQAVEVSRPVLAEKRHQLSVTPARAPLPLEADPTRLIQVFANIINNAAKYTDAGGRISIASATEGSEAVVTIGDDGMGMSRELLARAFDLFVQETRSLDRAQGGLGIGLTMVRTLVRLHGGSVEALSDGPGRGTTLVVRLPLATVQVGAPGEPPAPITTARGELRVLVVDDNVDAAQALGRLLELLGHRVTMAYDGVEALAAADALRPDLVLLDIGLPGMDGHTVAARLRDAGHRDAALVALTGHGQEDHLRSSTDAGFDHHLVKPVDFASLRQITAAVGRDTADR